MARDLDDLIAQLRLDEKAALLAGADMWSTVAVERLGIPAVRVTDGPNGARGPAVPGQFGAGEPLPAVCVPCGAALGATWDPELVEQVGRVLGEETRTKASRVLLAPTVNLHRSPLGGRNFESYSEDPLLAGRLAAAFVRGAQSRGVACTVKHFAGNEAETERQVADSIIDERTLRELYLLPFEIAVREGGALGIMTSYNRLNGEYCADSSTLLQGVLRDDWGFDGFVISDWFAFAQTTEAIVAGLDLEMPGPGRAYGPALAAAVEDGTVEEKSVDDAIRRLLGVLLQVGAFDDDPGEPGSEDRAEHREVARDAAASATVLLKNDGVLPLDPRSLRRVAVIGPNADRAVIMGGGSAGLTAHHLRSPLDALRDRLGADVEIVFEPGVDIARSTPEVPAGWLRAGGGPGVRIDLFAVDDLDGEPTGSVLADSGSMIWTPGSRPVTDASFSWRATTELSVPTAGRWLVSLVQTEPALLWIDDELVLDGHAHELVAGPDFIGLAKQEITAVIEIDPERPARVRIESTAPQAKLLTGAKLGLRPAPGPEWIDRAVAAATEADATIVVVGTDADWESEGGDRTSMHLPGDQDELIRRILEAAPDAVIVLNSGAPVATPWADDARALLQIWFGGQEMADALAEILVGDREPGGRLPTTIPHRIEDNPSWGNFPPADGRMLYGEGILVGYRWYESRRIDVAFPFGHGLSYSTFELGAPELSSNAFELGGDLRVRVPVTNTGRRAGSEVVELYVAPRSPGAFRPRKELKAFAKVTLDPGESGVVELHLDDRSFARWASPDPALDRIRDRAQAIVPWNPPPAVTGERGWIVDPGPYQLHIGRSSVDLAHVVDIDVPDGGSLGP